MAGELERVGVGLEWAHPCSRTPCGTPGPLPTHSLGKAAGGSEGAESPGGGKGVPAPPRRRREADVGGASALLRRLLTPLPACRPRPLRQWREARPYLARSGDSCRRSAGFRVAPGLSQVLGARRTAPARHGWTKATDACRPAGRAGRFSRTGGIFVPSAGCGWCQQGALTWHGCV